MASFDFQIFVSRAQLGLGDLNCNDGYNYRMSGGDLYQGQVTWERQTAKSPYVEGEFTTNRRRNNVQEVLTFDVYPGTSAGISGMTAYALQANIQQIVQAFTQDSFTIETYAARSTTWEQDWIWNCEAADYSVKMTNSRMVAQLGQVSFNVIRNPVPADIVWSMP
jgi:hypothetical protein